jgi:hypothetical protein
MLDIPDLRRTVTFAAENAQKGASYRRVGPPIIVSRAPPENAAYNRQANLVERRQETVKKVVQWGLKRKNSFISQRNVPLCSVP